MELSNGKLITQVLDSPSNQKLIRINYQLIDNKIKYLTLVQKSNNS